MNILDLFNKLFVNYLAGIGLFLIWLSLIYFSVVVTLFLIQNKLIYFPEKIDKSHSKNLISLYSNVEEIEITTPDKVVLHGWYVKNTYTEKAPLLIYFGGNAEELSYLVPEASRFKNFSLLLINYRGYGLSQGAPNEQNLCKDVELIYDQIIKRTDIDQEKIVVLGRSIGSGVAVHLARKRKIKGLILVTPFDSLISVVQEKYKFVPVSLILKSRFDSIAEAPKINIPLLALIAKNDEMFPTSHAIKLVNKWKGTKEVKIFEGVGHNTIECDKLYWECINKFLSGLIK